MTRNNRQALVTALILTIVSVMTWGASNFPTSIDSWGEVSNYNDTIDASHINDLRDAAEKLEAKVGADGSSVETSHDYILTEEALRRGVLSTGDEQALPANWPHSTIVISGDNQIYFGTRTDPAVLIRFNDPDGDLSDITSVTMNIGGTDYANLDSMCYDATNDVIYGTFYKSGYGVIVEIDPADIANPTIVYEDNTLDFGGSPAIVTDGTYVYGVTNTTDPHFFKIDVATWNLQADVDWNADGVTYGHAAAIVAGLAMYCTGTGTDEYGWAAKVSLSDLSHTNLQLTGVPKPTDDCAIADAYLWIGSELNELGCAVSIVDFDADPAHFKTFWAPLCYGVFKNGTDVYYLGSRDYLIDPELTFGYTIVGRRTAGYHLNEILRSNVQLSLNELAITGAGTIYATSWGDPGKLYELDWPAVNTDEMLVSGNITTPGLFNHVRIAQGEKYMAFRSVLGQELIVYDGVVKAVETIDVQDGSGDGTTSISTGAGSVKMSTANPADNTAWIPIQYQGTTYYVPAWTTHAPE